MQEEWINHMAKPDLIARIRKDRAAIAALWQNLSEGQMLHRPGPQSDWSVKDLVAHLSFWERLMMETISRLRQAAAPRSLASDAEIDTLNVEVFETNKDRPLDDVLSEFDGQLALVEATIMSLSEVEINDPAHFAQRDNAPLLYHLIGNTFGHYEDHQADLKRYIESLA